MTNGDAVRAPGGEIRFLDPRVIARLGSLEIKARMIVEGFLTGLHRSPYKGFSVEFAEYRQYMRGDDLSTLDWKVYARTDRHYVKKYEEETNLECHIALDVSASMGYGSTGVSKIEYASYLAASLGYLMQRQRDAVGLMAFDDDVTVMLQPSARPGRLRALLITLDRMKLGRRTDVAKPLMRLADMLVKRGLVVLISDLLDDPARVVDGLKRFSFRGSDVIVFHVLDPAELTFPFERPTRFTDLETHEEVATAPLLVKEHYLQQIRDMTEYYKRELALKGVDYCQLDTSQPLEQALMVYLTRRARLY
jgi:uncharacterized protein (DUF58 family)